MECRYARIRDGKPCYAPSVIVEPSTFAPYHIGVLDRIVNVLLSIFSHGRFVLARLLGRIVLYFAVCLLTFVICAYILEVRVPECLAAHFEVFANFVQDSWMKWICLLFLAITSLDVVFVCVGFVAHLIRLFRADVGQNGPLQYMMIDQPLEDDGIDELQRGAYVRSLALLLRGADKNTTAQYVGVYGAWGDGKTSVLSLLRKECRRDRFLFVDFNPWNYPSRENLPVLLFDAIAAKMNNKVSLPIAGLLRKLGRGLVAEAGKSFCEGIPVLGSVFSALATRSNDVQMIKRDLVEALKNCDWRIVVVVDDLDRLVSGEIYEVIRLIKANGDLPNVTYLILGDEEYLAQALSECVPHGGQDGNARVWGRKFLEKVITYPCRMPAVPKARVYAFVYTKLYEIAHRYRLPQEWVGDCGLIEEFVENMRDAKRLLSAIEVAIVYRIAKDGGADELNVDLADFVNLTIIKVAEPAAYDRLNRFCHLVYDGTQIDDKLNMNEEWMDRELMNYVNERHRSAFKYFLSRFLNIEVHLQHLPGTGGRLQKVTMVKWTDPVAVKNLLAYRLCSLYCIDGYFKDGEGDLYVPRAQRNEFVKAITIDHVVPKQLMVDFDKQSRLSFLIEILPFLELQTTAESCCAYLQALFAIVRDHPHGVQLPASLAPVGKPSPADDAERKLSVLIWDALCKGLLDGMVTWDMIAAQIKSIRTVDVAGLLLKYNDVAINEFKAFRVHDKLVGLSNSMKKSSK